MIVIFIINKQYNVKYQRIIHYGNYERGNVVGGETDTHFIYKNNKVVNDNYVIQQGWCITILPHIRNMVHKCAIIFGNYTQGLLNGTAYYLRECERMDYVFPGEDVVVFDIDEYLFSKKTFKNGIPKRDETIFFTCKSVNKTN